MCNAFQVPHRFVQWNNDDRCVRLWLLCDGRFIIALTLFLSPFCLSTQAPNALPVHTHPAMPGSTCTRVPELGKQTTRRAGTALYAKQTNFPQAQRAMELGASFGLRLQRPADDPLLPGFFC